MCVRSIVVVVVLQRKKVEEERAPVFVARGARALLSSAESKNKQMKKNARRAENGGPKSKAGDGKATKQGALNDNGAGGK
jgi:hypothetical protein